MIPIVEDFLKELLEDKLEHLHKDPSVVDHILDMRAERKDSLKQQLARKPIPVINGYPRTPSQLPCICILLSKETEEQEGLGDYGEDSYFATTNYMEEAFVLDHPNSRLPYASIITQNKPIESIGSIVNNTTGEILSPNEFYIANHQLGIIGLPNISPEECDSMTINYLSPEEGSSDIQVLYDSNFRVEVWTQNGDLTVELYHLIKWMLLGARDELVAKRGLVRQKLSGSDFEPVTSYFPEFVYRRALQFWCQFSASVMTERHYYIQEVESNIGVTTQAEIGREHIDKRKE